MDPTVEEHRMIKLGEKGSMAAGSGWRGGEGGEESHLTIL
jgi:hypothetical protein